MHSDEGVQEHLRFRNVKNKIYKFLGDILQAISNWKLVDSIENYHIHYLVIFTPRTHTVRPLGPSAYLVKFEHHSFQHEKLN